MMILSRCQTGPAFFRLDAQPFGNREADQPHAPYFQAGQRETLDELGHWEGDIDVVTQPIKRNFMVDRPTPLAPVLGRGVGERGRDRMYCGLSPLSPTLSPEYRARGARGMLSPFARLKLAQEAQVVGPELPDNSSMAYFNMAMRWGPMPKAKPLNRSGS